LIFRVPVDGLVDLREQQLDGTTQAQRHIDPAPLDMSQIRDAGGAARFTGSASAQNGPFGLAKRPLWRLSGLLRFSLPTGVSTFAFDCSASTRSWPPRCAAAAC